MPRISCKSFTVIQVSAAAAFAASALLPACPFSVIVSMCTSLQLPQLTRECLVGCGLSEKGDHLTPKHEDFEHDVKLDVEARVRQGVKAVLEEVLEEEMSEHLKAGYRELTPTRRGERNGSYQRNLVTPAGKIERLTVPRDREGEFVTEVFERYKRMTGDVEEAVLEMYLCGISVRKIAGVTDALSKVRVGKDAVSRIASRLQEQQKEWREHSLWRRRLIPTSTWMPPT